MSKLNFPERSSDLLPAIIQHEETHKVLMLGYFNAESLALTQETGLVHFFSRSKNRLWQKGETSGHNLALKSISLDCDQDTFLVRVLPRGPTCHLGTNSCFGDALPGSSLDFLMELEEIIDQQWRSSAAQVVEGSYLSQLKGAGLPRIAQKVGEEAVETVIAALASNDLSPLLEEAADLVFHLAVLLREKNTSLSQVAEILKNRNELKRANQTKEKLL